MGCGVVAGGRYRTVAEMLTEGQLFFTIVYIYPSLANE